MTRGEKQVIISAVLLALLLTGCGEPEQVDDEPTSDWLSSTKEDPITGRMEISAVRFWADSDKTIWDELWEQNNIRANLFFVCPPDENLWITIWGNEEDYNLTHQSYSQWQFDYRIGSTIVEKAVWNYVYREGRYALWVPNDNRRTVIDQFRNRTSDVFVIGRPPPGIPDGEELDISGFEAAVEPVLEACGW